MALEITIADKNGLRTIQAVGEVDLGSSPKLRRAILDNIGAAPSLGVDLSRVAYMDSSGVATLVEGLKSSTAKKQVFALVNPSYAVMKVLQLARLDSLFDIRAASEAN